MKRIARFLTVLLCAAVLAVPAAAQNFDDPIATDRPGLGTGTSVVAPGRVQIEAGTPGVELTSEVLDDFFRNEMNEVVPGEVENETRLINFPTLVRVGVVDRVELRVSSGVYSFFRNTLSGSTEDGSTEVDSEAETEGFPGLTVGAKAQVLRTSGYTLALVPRVSLPVGDDAFTADRAGFAADAVLGTALAEQIGLTLVAGGVLDPTGLSDDEYALGGNFVAVASRPLTESLGGYVEGAFQPSEAENAAYAGAGATYQIIPTAQLDVFFDRGLTDASTDWLFGGGVSIRFGD